MGINIDASDIYDLAADYGRIPNRATQGVRGAVEQTAKRGNTLAQGFARSSAGEHGKWYHRAFSAESAGLLSWRYGPRVGPRQGGMSFEFGSRNQPPHLDLARSADIIGPELQRSVGQAIGDVLGGR